VQYPGLQGGGALSDASIQDTPAGFIASSAHGGTYSHVSVAGGAWGGERGGAAATAAAAARCCRETPTGGAGTPPRSAPAQGGRGGRHGARAGSWDRPRATRRLLPRRSMASETADEPPQQIPATRLSRAPPPRRRDAVPTPPRCRLLHRPRFLLAGHVCLRLPLLPLHRRGAGPATSLCGQRC